MEATQSTATRTSGQEQSIVASTGSTCYGAIFTLWWPGFGRPQSNRLARASTPGPRRVDAAAKRNDEK